MTISAAWCFGVFVRCLSDKENRMNKIKIGINKHINTIIFCIYHEDDEHNTILSPYEGIMTLSRIAQQLKENDLSDWDIVLNSNKLLLTIVFFQERRAEDFAMQVIAMMERNDTIYNISDQTYIEIPDDQLIMTDDNGFPCMVYRGSY